MPRGNPTTVIRLPAELLDRIDADAKRQGKASRTQWLIDLSEAVLAGRLVPARSPSVAARPLVDRPVRSYPKSGK